VVLIVIARGGVVQIADFDAVTEFPPHRKHRGRDLFETLMWEYAEEAGMLRGRR
jgi:hypothetical protein